MIRKILVGEVNERSDSRGMDRLWSDAAGCDREYNPFE